tara:strand:+ start:238 stop:525 length:288 start_codon:yes stop_codon:yes gene_type:complete
MSWLKTLWNKLVAKTSTSATVVEVEEVASETAGEIFQQICLDAGIPPKYLSSLNIASIFEQWYDGPINQEAIEQSIADFKTAHPGQISAKLNSLK